MDDGWMSRWTIRWDEWERQRKKSFPFFSDSLLSFEHTSGIICRNDGERVVMYKRIVFVFIDGLDKQIMVALGCW